MKKLSILAMGLLFVLTTACSVSGSGTLFDGKDSNKWKMTGDVSVQDDIMTLKGTDALAVLKNGKYKNFDLTLDLRTPGRQRRRLVPYGPDLEERISYRYQ